MAKTKEVVDYTIERLERGEVTLYLLGTSELIMNRLAKKAREELLLPRRSLNKAARASTLKHVPVEEFRDSIYRCRDPQAPTLLHMPNGSVKKAMSSAALDMEGATKAEIGRLVKVVDETVHIFGIPYLYMAPVRQGGFKRTPDMRTRALLKEWAFSVTVRYVRNKIREQDIVNLMDAAGDIIGIGDGRTEKGTFNFGSWKIVEKGDKQWNEIVRAGGRRAQEAAMAKPEASDIDSEELWSWYEAEIIRRERDRPMRGGKAPSGAVVADKASRANGKPRVEA
jgi:hypothetical protein